VTNRAAVECDAPPLEPLRCPPMPCPPLLIRLPNHLGDTLMTLPALTRVAAAGCLPVLVGQAWAVPLLAALPWPVHAVSTGLRREIGQWRRLRAQTGVDRALLFTNSFRSALAARLSGLSATGYATDGRRLLLAHAVPVPARWRGDMHTVEYYDALAAAWLGEPQRQVPAVSLALDARSHAAARELLASAGVAAPYVVLCPGATGRHRGRNKTWNDFDRLTAWLLARGERVVALPGPGERARFESVLPGATILPEAHVATFAALLAASRLVVANDSGPGHLAAAVGARLISLFGVTEVEKTRPWGRRVTVLGGLAGWPSFDEVAAAVGSALTGPAPCR
jgi:heptosyltransferase-2